MRRGAGCGGAATALPAHAQIDWHKIDIWKPYRREDLGFEVEMPGDPEIEEEKDEDGHSTYVDFLFIGMGFSVDHTVLFKRDATIERVIRHQRNTAKPSTARSHAKLRSPWTGFPRSRS